MPDYRYIVADLLTNTIKEEIPFSTVSFGRALCRPGAFSARIRYTHPKATRANLDPARTALYVERDGVIVWGGIIWTARRAQGSEDVEVGAEGFWSYFRRRLIRRNYTFTAADQLTIAQTLVNDAQSATISPGGNIGVLVDATASGVARDRVYNSWERKNLGEAVEQLAAVQGGFDFAIECQWESGVITKRLRWNYPKRGRRTAIVLELGTNIDALGWVLDGTRFAWHVDVLGAGEGKSMLLATSADPSQAAAYPLLEDVVSMKDVSVAATLAAHAQSELAARNHIGDVSNLSARVTDDTQIGTWIEGDEVYVRAHDTFIDIDGWYRVVADSVNVSDEGYESASLVVTGSEAFA